jgi:hypothetical protein
MRMLVSLLVALGSLAMAPQPHATAPGGSHQIGALAGCTNQWLFNGVWRVRVVRVASVVKDIVQYPGYAVTIEARNGSQTTTSMAYSGVGDGGTLVLDDGNTLNQDTDEAIAWHSDYFKDILPGAGFTFTLKYYLPNKPDTTPKPQKWILDINPKSRGTQAPHYTTANPSLRVDLTCKK